MCCILHCLHNERCKAVFKKTNLKFQCKNIFLLIPVYFNCFQCDLVDVRVPHVLGGHGGICLRATSEESHIWRDRSHGRRSRWAAVVARHDLFVSAIEALPGPQAVLA